MESKIESVKQLLRSVLLSSKTGVKATQLQGEYKELCGSYIPHDKLGFSSLHEFMLSLKDVVRIGQDADHDLTYFAIADSTTQHIQAMVAKQKPKKVNKKKAPSSYVRNKTHFKPHQPPPSNKPYRQPSFKPPFYGNIKRKNNHITQSQYHQKVVGKKSPPREHDMHSNNQFTSKPSSRFPSKQQKKSNHLYSSNPSTFQNPLSSYSEFESTVKVQSDNNFDDPPHTHIDDEAVVKSNLKKLLSVNPHGLHSSRIRTLYRDTYSKDVLLSTLNEIVTNSSSDYAAIEKVNVGEDKKFILFPSHNKGDTHVDSYHSGSVDESHLKSSVQRLQRHCPLNPGEDYEVSIVHFVDCDKLYVQLVSEEEQRKKMLQLISELFARPDSKKAIRSGSYVVTKDFFRAKVVSISDCQVQLYNIDQTDATMTYWTSLDQIQLMPGSIAEFPEFLITCTLHRPTGTGKWHAQSSQKFHEMYANMPLIITPVKVSSMKSIEQSSLVHEHCALFYKKSSGGKTNINARLVEEETALLEALKSCCNPLEFQPSGSVTLPNEEYCELYVFNVSCCTEVNVCVIGEGYSDELVKLENAMTEFYSKAKNTFHLPQPLPIDCIYAVLFGDSCMRGRLVSVDHDQATVYLIDNCDYDTVSTSALYPLTEEFAKLPIQGIKVSLAGLDHDVLATHSKILQTLNEVAIYKTCASRIVGRFGTANTKFTYIVELFDSTGPVDNNINHMCFDLILDENLCPEIPPENGMCAVSVSTVDVKSNSVFARLAGEGMVKLTECLTEIKATFANQRIPPSKWATNLYPGKLCLVRMFDSIFRARVTSVEEGKSRGVSVFLIDHGSFEQVSRSMVFKLEDEKAISIPPQAISCIISGDEQSGDSTQFLGDVSEKIKVSSVIMKFNQVSEGEDPHLVSLWIDEEAKIQILPNIKKDSETESVQDKKIFKSASPVLSLMQTSVKDLDCISKPNSGSKGQNIKKLTQQGSLSSLRNNLENLSVEEITYKSDVQQPKKGLSLLQAVKTSESDDGRKLTYEDIQMIQSHQQLNLSENPFPVRIENVTSPDYLQIIALKNLPSRKILTSFITNYYYNYNSKIVVSNPVTGKMFALCDPIEKQWYRVEVLCKTPTEINVYLIDYGECRVVKKEHLHILHEKFQFVEPLVMTAKLTGIEPSGKDNTCWQQHVSDDLSKLIKGNCYYAHILKITNSELLQGRSVWEVCLCDTTSQNDIWINDLLVEKWKYAKYVA